MRRVVAYYLLRTSVANQRALTEDFQVVQEYAEKGMTGQQDWPVLRRACRRAKQLRVRLLLVKLGRLRWNLSLLHALEVEHVEFDCLDHEELNEQSLGFQIVWAQDKAQRMANIMRDRMADLKAQGVKFGFAAGSHRSSRACADGIRKGAEQAARIRSKRTAAAYQFLIPRVRELRETMTWDAIVEQLNEEGEKTSEGKPFNRPTLIRIMQRAKE